MLRHTKVKLAGEEVTTGFETKKTIQPSGDSPFSIREKTLRMN